MSDVATKHDEQARLQLHLEPNSPIEVYELTMALNSLSRQYNYFVETQRIFDRSGDARLLISSVSPGSIDINFVPDLHNAIALAAPFVSDIKVVSEFADSIKKLFSFFKGDDDNKEVASKARGGDDISIRDCEDTINILKPIVEHGGNQTINVYKGPVLIQNISLSGPEARKITENAARTKAELQFPQAERHQRVSMVWDRLDRAAAKTRGSSPDKGIIGEIDPKPKTILFTDELSYLKNQMVGDQENPMQKVYFVDVEVSRVADRITAYRIVGFHGTDDLDQPSTPEDLGL